MNRVTFIATKQTSRFKATLRQTLTPPKIAESGYTATQ